MQNGATFLRRLPPKAIQYPSLGHRVFLSNVSIEKVAERTGLTADTANYSDARAPTLQAESKLVVFYHEWFNKKWQTDEGWTGW